MPSREPPADFDARSEMRFERRHGQSHETDEYSSCAQLGRAQAETVLLEMRLDAIHGPVALLARQHYRKKLHHARVRVHAGEGLAVSGKPATENQTFGLSDDHPRRCNRLTRTPSCAPVC